ncbi:MAG: sigma-54-dependent Fis family transcriptional regulator, partial [Chitinivibrionales bacterium]|nr:sigma-54-dependent Fis family transcriptional regulator [Chitinivibrionales bacterium]MBD3358986.1 sigma-54-dependent Fis family transcriptional regulator [Chitinivibrionales bacterium]
EYKPLGCEYVKQSDVRVIAASNADLTKLLSCGAIREDFYYRLNVMILSLPALREREGDIEELANHFLGQYCVQYGLPKKRFHSATLAWMKNHSWPGNVRELDSFVHRAFLLSSGPLVHLPATSLDFPKKGAEHSSPWMNVQEGKLKEAKARYIDRFEKHYLKQLMAECQGNVSLAARRAGKERRAFGKLLKKHSIERADYFQSA